jgi:L-amino acid N-acyltransferase YncA
MVLSGYPKTAKLKDGTLVTLRPMVAGDLDALHEFFSKDVPEEDRQFLKDDVADRKVIENWVEKLDYDRVLPILVFHGDRVIGDGTLKQYAGGWFGHMGEARMVIAREYQGRGAGVLLLKELVQVAHVRKTELLQAQILEDMPNGIAVFQKMGFRVEAVLRDFAQDRKGKRQNLVIMVRDVSELWKRMEDLLLESDWRGDS